MHKALFNRRRRSGGSPFAAYTISGNAPTLVMDAGASLYGLDGAVKPQADVIPLTRSTIGSYVNSSGVLATAAIDELRMDYDPVTLAVRGVLIEPAATNILLNSDTLVTQTVAVADLTEYTLHFTGTGSVTNSGADTTVLAGTGAGEANRVSATFTTAGTSLTLTVSGTVSNCQLETGGTVSSYIATAGAAVTRAKDIPRVLTSAFNFSATAGTIVSVWEAYKDNYQRAWQLDDGGNAEAIGLYRSPGSSHSLWVVDGGANQADISGGVSAANGPHGSAAAWALNDGAHSANGGAVGTDGAMTLPTVTQLVYGNRGDGTRALNGRLKSLVYYPTRLSDADLVLASTL